MEKYLDALAAVGLFQGVDAAELISMLRCMGAETKKVEKGDILLLAGGKPRHIGIVLTGQLHIVREDYDGNRSIIANLTPGEIYAEALCCADVAESPVTVIAGEDSAVMLVGFARILNACSNACSYHTKLIGNMLGLMAGKNLLLQSRMEIMGLKSIRARVTLYLKSFRPERGREFTIPFNREEMADYLCVERSALSHELAKMRKDGLIEYRKDRFVIMDG